MINSYFKFIRSGINTTYQDKGRENLYHIGIPYSGAMDNRNFLIANKLVNNNLNAPVLEFAYQGPHLKYQGDTIIIAITGDVIFKIIKNGVEYTGNCYESYQIENGDEIDIISTNKTIYGYLAIGGEIDIKFQWKSCSINTNAKIGSNNGKKLENNQTIKLLKLNSNKDKKKIDYTNSKVENIRVIKGTNFNYFSDEGIKTFFDKKFIVSKLSDRMGMRLQGNKINNVVNTNIKSEGLIKGVIPVSYTHLRAHETS